MKLWSTAILGLLVLACAVRAEEEFDEEVGDAEEIAIEEENEDRADIPEPAELVEEDEEIEEEEGALVDIQTYFPESVITAGKVAEVLVSVKISKEATDEYTFGTIEGGFHYPTDWSYKVQNFSAIRYNRKLVAGEEATFMFPFMAAELSGGRTYGMQINIHYQSDTSPPKFASDAVFNSTIDVMENLDNAAAEQFFMFLTFSGFAGIAFAYFTTKFGTKKKAAAVVVETGTTAGADQSWIPKEHLKSGASPKTSPKSSARKRTTKAE